MDQITETIWLGDAHDGIDIPGLKAHNITAVLSVLREGLGYADWAGAGIIHTKIAMDDGEPGQLDLLGQAVTTLNLLLKEGHTVLVHCGAGISRSSTVVIGYLIYSKQFTTWEAAETFVASRRPVIWPHPFLRRSMKKWLELWPYDGTYRLPETENLLDN